MELVLLSCTLIQRDLRVLGSLMYMMTGFLRWQTL
ncbi:hypothetical protein I3843_02G039800 [Carya illinoinensis]|nr:hypothetical protein I3843_02G039800 [Carya illinoinensis]